VFNLEQLDGVADTLPVAANEWTPLAAAESVLRHSGATIRHQGYKAFYSTVNDWIYLPQQRMFANAESYYATALHELTHWTGLLRHQHQHPALSGQGHRPAWPGPEHLCR